MWAGWISSQTPTGMAPRGLHALHTRRLRCREKHSARKCGSACSRFLRDLKIYRACGEFAKRRGAISAGGARGGGTPPELIVRAAPAATHQQGVGSGQKYTHPPTGCTTRCGTGRSFASLVSLARVDGTLRGRMKAHGFVFLALLSRRKTCTSAPCSTAVSFSDDNSSSIASAASLQSGGGAWGHSCRSVACYFPHPAGPPPTPCRCVAVATPTSRSCQPTLAELGRGLRSLSFLSLRSLTLYRNPTLRHPVSARSREQRLLPLPVGAWLGRPREGGATPCRSAKRANERHPRIRQAASKDGQEQS